MHFYAQCLGVKGDSKKVIHAQCLDNVLGDVYSRQCLGKKRGDGTTTDIFGRMVALIRNRERHDNEDR